MKLVVPAGLEATDAEGASSSRNAESDLKTLSDSVVQADASQHDVAPSTSEPPLIAIDSKIPETIETPPIILVSGETESSSQPSDEAQANGAPTTDGWFVRLPSGDQFGPANPGLFANWIGEGRVPHDALVWRQGWAEWRPASEVPECQPETSRQSTQDASNPTVDQVAKNAPTHIPQDSSHSGDPPTTEQVGSIRIETNRPLARRVNRKPIIVIMLVLTCLLLAIPLVYVFVTSG